VRNTV